MWNAKTCRAPYIKVPDSALIAHDWLWFRGSASFSPDGSRIVTGSDDKKAKVWDAKTGAELLTLNHVDSASFSPDGLRIVTASEDGRRRCGTRKTGAEVLTLKGHTDTRHIRRRLARTGRGS